ncbi:MAG: HAD family hydrolase [Aliishimia sp.]
MNKIHDFSSIKGVLFDKDGTLFDFARTWEAWAQSFLKRITPDAETAHRVGAEIGFDMELGNFSADSIVIAGSPDEVGLALLPHLPGYDLPGLLEVLNEEAAQAPQVEAAPLVPLLTSFRSKGLTLGVATNDAEKPARAHLGQAGVTGLFDFIAGYDSGFGAKPKPGQLNAFAQQMGLAPSTCMMVGDSRHDLGAGRAAGFVTVGVLTGYATSDDLIDLADVILPDIGHLGDLLN